MIFARRTKLPVVAAVLLSASLALGATKAEKHPVTHHKAHKASHPAATHHVSAHPAPKHANTHRSSRKSRKRPRGQQAIDNGRARQIQEALVREHYLTGEPSGTWDAATQAAMRRYQAQQGWQSKTVPDSRALIRLGLGPDQGHLLNPESAMITSSVPRAEASARAATAPSATVPAATSAPVSAPASISPGGSPQ
jgi:Putative peptidoglycan binding domain